MSIHMTTWPPKDSQLTTLPSLLTVVPDVGWPQVPGDHPLAQSHQHAYKMKTWLGLTFPPPFPPPPTFLAVFSRQALSCRVLSVHVLSLFCAVFVVLTYWLARKDGGKVEWPFICCFRILSPTLRLAFCIFVFVVQANSLGKNYYKQNLISTKIY